MPELPEVEVTRQGIAPALVGHRTKAAIFRTPRLRYPLPHELATQLPGQKLMSIHRRGKYLLLAFERGHLLIHLGMSGSLRLLPLGVAPEKHDHVDLVFDCGTVLRMRDPRRFGAVLWLSGDPLQHPLLSVLGIEPLTDEFNGLWLKHGLGSLKAAIKPTLMDGHRIVGIGNIYASESLFRARIDPRTVAGKISLRRLERLVGCIKETLTEAINAGGSSLRDFIHSDGSTGYFQTQYFVYGRTGQACRVCGHAIQDIRQGQRATFFCARCQR